MILAPFYSENPTPIKCDGKPVTSIMYNNNKIYRNTLFNYLKDHIVGWYNPVILNATNESLAENPVLKDLSFKGNNVNWKDSLYRKMMSRAIFSISTDGHTINVTNIIDENNFLETQGTMFVSSPKNIVVFVSGLPENAKLVYRYCGIITDASSYKDFYILKDGKYELPYSEELSLYNQGWRVLGFTGECNITIKQRAHNDLQLHNFAFGGLSGIGSYVALITGYLPNRFEGTYDNHKLHVTKIIQTEIPNFVNIKTNSDHYFVDFKVTGLPHGAFVVFHKDIKGSHKTKFGNGINRVYLSNNVSAVGVTGLSVGAETDITIELLPQYPDSLVFNGCAPKYHFNKNNLNLLSEYGEWLSFNKYHIIGNGNQQVNYLDYYYTGVAGETLNVTIPSFKVRVTLKGNEKKQLNINAIVPSDSGNTYLVLLKAINSGTYIIPEKSFSVSLEDDTIIPKIRIYVTSSNDNIDIEFLPTYDAPTTQMYADIPNVPLNTVKCMMMDFVPFGEQISQWYYSQRNGYTSKFAIITVSDNSTNKDLSKILAYSDKNILGTYINGHKNYNYTIADMLQLRQVVSVNQEEPDYTSIVLGHDFLSAVYPQMALNSLILFDKELTEEEMWYVMNNMMDIDNSELYYGSNRQVIAGDLVFGNIGVSNGGEMD